MTDEQETGVLPDRLDIQPKDSELMAEIQMLAHLILACSTTSAHLEEHAIDAALGLTHNSHGSRWGHPEPLTLS